MSKIILVEELRERERLALLLLQKVLEARGHIVRRTSFDNLVATYLDFSPDLIFENTSTSVAHYLGNFLWLSPETRIVEGIWEQILNVHSFRRFDFPESIQNQYFDGRISWGPAFKETMAFLNPNMDPNRIGVVGSIKHAEGYVINSLSRKRLSSLYPFDVGEFSKVVLCATSFSLAPLDVESLKKRYTFNPFLEYFHQQMNCMRGFFTRVLGYLVEKYEDCLFLVRAHPSKSKEYYEYYEKAIGEYPNLVLYSGGPISSMLVLSDLVLTSSSTVLIDSYLQSTPALNLMLRDPLYDFDLLPLTENQFGYPIYEDAVDNLDLDQYFGKVERTGQKDQLVTRWIGDHSRQVYGKWADFFEYVLALPPLPKPISWRTMCSLDRWRHATSCFVERFLHHRRNRPVKSAGSDEFDYFRLMEMLEESEALRDLV
jgi:hypothetical protein